MSSQDSDSNIIFTVVELFISRRILELGNFFKKALLIPGSKQVGMFLLPSVYL